MNKHIDYGIEFENWICHTLPWQLNLSKAKEVHLRTQFSPFADHVRPLVEKAPKEFERFFKALKKGVAKASKRRAPRGHVIIPQIHKGNFERYPNGKLRHHLVEK